MKISDMNTIFSTAILSFCQRNQINHIDAEIIVGLKSSDSFIRDFYVKRLFYKELRGLLSAIQYSLFKGRVEYDELVNELYVYLSQNNWAALDTYRGDNKARLNSWLTCFFIPSVCVFHLILCARDAFLAVAGSFRY